MCGGRSGYILGGLKLKNLLIVGSISVVLGSVSSLLIFLCCCFVCCYDCVAGVSIVVFLLKKIWVARNWRCWGLYAVWTCFGRVLLGDGDGIK